MGRSEDIRSPDIREERRGRRIYSTLMLKGIVSVARILATNARDIKRLRTMQTSEVRYVRPLRRYTLPPSGKIHPHELGMQSGQRDARYLRPTRYCNSCAPEVVALAHSLGAYRVSDRAFAQAAFAFAKDKMTLEIAPIDGAVESLQRGTGTCFELISVFIALCRAAGVKARYKIFPSNMIQAWREATIDADPLLQQWYDALGYFLLEGEGEAFIDGQWVVAHVGPTAERQAAARIPISRLGEDAIGSWFHVRPETVMRMESLPLGLAEGSWLLHKISPGSMERVNVSVLQEIARGRQIIAEAGGVDAYDAQARNGQKSDFRPRKAVHSRE